MPDIDLKTATPDETLDIESGIVFGCDSQSDATPYPRALRHIADAIAARAETVTNKTITLSGNTITGTLDDFNDALTDANFATLTGAETLTNKTLTAPEIATIANAGATLTLPTSSGTIARLADIAAAGGGDVLAANNLSELTDKSAARTNLGLAIGTNVQAYDADLATWAGITPAAGVGTFLGTPTSANLAAAMTDETGSGALVFANSPTLITPALGTPASGTLTNCIGLPLGAGVTGTLAVANGGTGVASIPAIQVVRTADQTGIAHATFTKIQFNSEEYDNTSTFDSSTNYRWTPNVAGKYFFALQVTMLGVADTKIIAAGIYKNGALAKFATVIQGGTGDGTAYACGIISLNGSTDYIEGYCYHEHGSARDLRGGTYYSQLCGYRVGA